MLFFLYVLLYVKIIIAFLPLYAAEAWYFGAPKYPKRFVNPAMSLLHNPMRIKKTAALRLIRYCCVLFGLIEPFGVCVQYFFKKFKSSFMNTKPLRFRFVTAIFTVVHLFF